MAKSRAKLIRAAVVSTSVSRAQRKRRLDDGGRRVVQLPAYIALLLQPSYMYVADEQAKLYVAAEQATWPRTKSEVRVDKLRNAPSAVYKFLLGTE